MLYEQKDRLFASCPVRTPAAQYRARTHFVKIESSGSRLESRQF